MVSPPYSPAVRAGDLLFVSGQLSMRDGELVEGDIVAQTRLALENLDRVLQANGAHRGQVVKTLVLLSDMADWAAMNGPYGEFFAGGTLPARSAFAVGLIEGALVEIEAVAHLG
jgi:2-iminobutanoate/2-iminopropanoate deaminase